MSSGFLVGCRRFALGDAHLRAPMAKGLAGRLGAFRVRLNQRLFPKIDGDRRGQCVQRVDTSHILVVHILLQVLKELLTPLHARNRVDMTQRARIDRRLIDVLLVKLVIAIIERVGIRVHQVLGLTVVLIGNAAERTGIQTGAAQFRNGLLFLLPKPATQLTVLLVGDVTHAPCLVQHALE